MTTETTAVPQLTSSLDGRQIVVVDVPAGHGRKDLLRALVEAAPERTVRVPAPERAGDVDTVIDALERAVTAATGSDPEVTTVVIDDVHRGGPDLLDALTRCCGQLPTGVRLLIGGAGLGSLSLGERVSDGSAVRLGPEQLPLRTTGDALTDVLRDAWRDDLDDRERLVADAAITNGVVRHDRVTRLADALGHPGAHEGLARLPLVEVGPTHVTVDERWCEIADLDTASRRPVASTLANVLVDGPCDESDLRDAGELAIAAADAAALRRVVRAALSVHPPRVGAHALRSWRESGLLDRDDAHARWLAGVCDALHGARLDRALDGLRAARAGFAEHGDQEAEIDAGLALGIVARRSGDLATLAELVARSHELEANGATRAANTRLLGEALLHQMVGDPHAALAALDRIPSDAFDGDWAAQVLMMRGTNLLLCGRPDEAVAQLTAATGVGSAWSYSTALSLLATARWSVGDSDRALDDLRTAELHARRVGAVVAADLSAATRAAMLAAFGDPGAGAAIAAAATGDHLDDEGRRLLDVARALDAVQSGDLGLATRLIADVAPPERATLSTSWAVALQTALGTRGADRWAEVVDRHAALRPALEAGRGAARHLAGGAPATAGAAPYLPSTWCEAGTELVELELLGAATVRRARRPVEHRSWDRGRVRELCLHLALVDDTSRELTAGRLWPELAPDAAARNLRVTLSHLLDVLDPDRPRGTGSDLIDERQGVLRFAATERLRIDVRRAAEAAQAIVEAAAAGDDRALLAEARRLARESTGQFLAGASIGEWVEPYARLRADLMLRAVAAAAPAALRAGDADLAEELVRRGLELDPWAERLHQLLVRARLARDDLDGARRAWREAIAVLDELGVSPERTTLQLGAELGLR